ncbi:MAG TPA: CDGSH iron-sulfur domain-containing protein [Solirubrobacterales bacterium]|jgi:CDGSH-type Zn-finger protein|nr:CDGSH iron-sulfur domain-containing protein [Solirubrobacterales bacterium]
MAEVQIEVTDNGPYKVTGPIELIDADGGKFTVREGKSVFLCRCGGSLNKPFCDSTHSKVGFEAAQRAVAEAESS